MLLRAVLDSSPSVVEELRLVCGHLAAAGLRPVGPDRLEVVLARFGNVTPDVAQGLADALVEGVAGLPGCAVAFRGPRIDGGAVVADLVGEVDRLAVLASTVARVAAASRIYVDRRVFRSGLVLAELDPLVHGSAAERAVQRLSRWHSSAWEASGVTLMRTGWRGAEAFSERWYAVPLQSHESERPTPLG